MPGCGFQIVFHFDVRLSGNGKEKGGRGGRGKEWRGVERDGEGWREGEGMERGGEGWRGMEGWWGSGNKVRFMTKS